MSGQSLAELIRPERKTAVVDIGANPIDGEPIYSPLLRANLCNVVGFEPQDDALAALNARKSAAELYLPYVIGDGAAGMLRVCHESGMTSLLRPDPRAMKYFRHFEAWARVTKEIPVTTRRLDDVSEISNIDFLKIDVQGSELAVFRNGPRCLAEAVAVQTEISFTPLYEGQPTFGEIDMELRSHGFVPHCFTEIKRWMISPIMADNPFAAMNQLLEGDIVYVRDFTRPELMRVEQLKHLAIIAHYCYRSFDLAANCLHRLIERDAVKPEALSNYVARMPQNYERKSVLPV